jgi:hypothetical protein
MIIKSMSRKEASFGQLLNYMNREVGDEAYSLRHNVYARQERELEMEFTNNARHMKARKNGVFLYHEILSISKTSSLSEHDMKDALRRIAHEYVQARAPCSLVYGVVHDDHTHHLHYHLMISANEAGDEKRIRLSKADFQKTKVDLERRVLSEFPELEQKVAMDKQSSERMSQRGEELKRRTGETPERDGVKSNIHQIFADSLDRQELFERLRAANLNLYVRGKNIGIVHEISKRKYRLNRLGLEERFATLSKRIETVERVERESSSQEALPAQAQPAIVIEEAVQETDILAIAKERADRLRSRAEKENVQDKTLKRDR